jgi:hypothetical protein
MGATQEPEIIPLGLRPHNIFSDIFYGRPAFFPGERVHGLTKASRKNNLSNYGAEIMAAGKALARRTSAGSVTSEQRRQRPKEPARMPELFFRDA